MKKIIFLISLIAVCACSNVEIENNYPNDPENSRKQRAGKFSNISKLLKD